MLIYVPIKHLEIGVTGNPGDQGTLGCQRTRYDSGMYYVHEKKGKRSHTRHHLEKNNLAGWDFCQKLSKTFFWQFHLLDFQNTPPPGLSETSKNVWCHEKKSANLGYDNMSPR